MVSQEMDSLQCMTLVLSPSLKEHKWTAASLYDTLTSQADPSHHTVTPLTSMMSSTFQKWGLSIKLCTPLLTHKKEALASSVIDPATKCMYHIVDDHVHQVIVHDHPSHYSVLRGNKELDIILTRLKNEWVVRQSAKLQGWQVSLDKHSVGLNEAVFRCATVLVGSDIKAVFVQVECQQPTSSTTLQTLLSRLCGHLMPLDFKSCPTLKDAQQAHISPQHHLSLHKAYQLVVALRASHVL